MKVLVATGLTQGERPDDFNNCVDGELVWMREACPEGRSKQRKRCVCRRAFLGMSSLKDTTTVLVRDVPGLTRNEFDMALRACFGAAGWCSCCTTQSVEEFVEEVLLPARLFPEGAVLERRRDGLWLRAQLEIASLSEPDPTF
ncbi:hypothetical protein GCM10022381_35680 [Leifsonia kafniensis]|uniref:DUF7715 domain-containing protein n=2 Tax=Leifsonia kafniensis TaxID=475957 RepID=A0ABP7L0X5_9MICO